jgi:hypothetical protein
MKKFLLVAVFSTTLLMTSCCWLHETFTSVESCAEWYCDELYDAAKDGDVEDFRDRTKDLAKWMIDLSDADKKRVVKTIENYDKKYPGKSSVIEKFARKHRISL